MNAFMAKGRWFLFFVLTTFCMSCGGLPVIKQMNPQATPETVQRCHLPFLSNPYRFIHSIEATVPGGSTGVVLGITVFDPAANTIHSAIITIDGFVLFDAWYDEKGIHIDRALPPFDAQHLARPMMEDIRLLFMAPDGYLSDAGLLEDGSTICRYHEGENMIEDVVVHQDSTWEIAVFSGRHERLRTIRALSVQDGIPAMVELTGSGPWSYSLQMRLISAEQVSPESIRQIPGQTQDED
jgi:hypothetical protein